MKLRLVASLILSLVAIGLPVAAVVSNGPPWGFRGHEAVVLEVAGTVEAAVSEARRQKENRVDDKLDVVANLHLDSGDEVRVARLSQGAPCVRQRRSRATAPHRRRDDRVALAAGWSRCASCREEAVRDGLDNAPSSSCAAGGGGVDHPSYRRRQGRRPPSSRRQPRSPHPHRRDAQRAARSSSSRVTRPGSSTSRRRSTSA